MIKTLLDAIDPNRDGFWNFRYSTISLCVIAIGAVASDVCAQSENDIVRGVNEVLRKVVFIIGPTVLGFGLVRGFTAFSSGDEEGMQTARNAVIGGLGVIFTFAIVNFVVRASGLTP